MAVTLVVAWDTDLKEALGYRRAVNKRHAQAMAEELAHEYPWSPRISYYQEVDFIATEAGMTEAEVKVALERLTSTKKAEA